jgi:hypothetical protein
VDNPLFPAWLAGILRATSTQIAFVSLWDSNGGCQCAFTPASSAGKPLEAAAWAANFGGSAPALTPATFTVSPSNTQINGTTGSITDTGGNVWTITSGQQIARNGVAVPSSAGVVTLFWTGAAPAGYKPPAPAIVVSAADTMITPGSGSITDTLGNVWTINAAGYLFCNGVEQNASYKWGVGFWTGSALFLGTPHSWTAVNLSTKSGTLSASAPSGYTPG